MLCFVGLRGIGGCKIFKAEILRAKSLLSVACGPILEYPAFGVMNAMKLPRIWGAPELKVVAASDSSDHVYRG
jgi:hypothetical protein